MRARELILVLSMLTCGCAGERPHHNWGERPYLTEYLSGGSYKGKKLTLVEAELSLPTPFAWRLSDDLSPVWWFYYSIDDMMLGLATNTERPDSPLNRQAHWCTLDAIVIPSKEWPRGAKGQLANKFSYEIKGPFEAPSGSIPAEFLRSLNPAESISISEIENFLKLSNPNHFSPPAFINPVWTFFYKTDGCYVKLCAVFQGDADPAIAAMNDRSTFQFANAWSASCDSTAKGEGP